MGLAACGVLAGFSAGLIILGLFLGLFASVVVKQEARSVRQGWKLTLVLAAARNVPTGAKLRDEDLDERVAAGLASFRRVSRGNADETATALARSFFGLAGNPHERSAPQR